MKCMKEYKERYKEPISTDIVVPKNIILPLEVRCVTVEVCCSSLIPYRGGRNTGFCLSDVETYLSLEEADSVLSNSGLKALMLKCRHES